MVTGPLLVVALSVASIVSAAPIFDLDELLDFESEESEENAEQEQKVKNIIIVNVSGLSVYPNSLTTSTGTADNDMPGIPQGPNNRGIAVNKPTPASVTTAATPTAAANVE